MHVGEAARLRDEVSGANTQIQQMHADLQAWEQAVSSRDTELRNLQVATHHYKLWLAWMCCGLLGCAVA